MRKTEIETNSNKTKGQELEIPCTQCAARTSHKVIQSVEVSGCEDLGPEQWFEWNNEYQIVQCQGCKTISFRQTHCNSEDYNQIGFDGELEMALEENLYPSRVEGRKALEDTHLLPSEVRLIYNETHKAISNGLRVLTGIGLRAIIETVCKEKAVSGRNLHDKIDDLVARGLLSQDGADILHKLRILGNKAAHEVEPHPPDQLALAIDVAEHLLEGTYIFPEKARRTFK